MLFADWDKLPEGVVGSLIYGAIGILLMLGAFKLFDWCLPNIHFQKELCDDKNVAVAIVVAAILLGVAYVVGQIIR